MTTHNEHGDRHNEHDKAQQDQGREAAIANAMTASANTSINANVSSTDNLLDFPIQPPPEYSASERKEFLRLSTEHGHIAAEWNDLLESCGGTMSPESKMYAQARATGHAKEARKLLLLGRPELRERLVGVGEDRPLTGLPAGDESAEGKVREEVEVEVELEEQDGPFFL